MLARDCRLHRQLLEDALQDAALAFVQAVSNYDPGLPGADTPAYLHAFLKRRLTSRFLDFLRAQHRFQKHLDRSADVETVVEEVSGDVVHHRATQDPLEVAKRTEALARLERTIRELHEGERKLLECVRSGMTQGETAHALGLSRRGMERARGELCRKLAGLCEAWFD